MLEQPFLPGLGLSGVDTLFFAVQPGEHEALEIERLVLGLRGALGLKGRPIARSRLHITLCGAGTYDGMPRDVTAKAIEAAESVRMPPFEVVLDRAMSFRRPSRRRPFVLIGDCNEGLQALHHALEEGMKRTGLGRGTGSSYTPHLTMLYDFGSVAERPVRPVGWVVSEFVLIHSLVGRSRYVRLGRWVLRG